MVQNPLIISAHVIQINSITESPMDTIILITTIQIMEAMEIMEAMVIMDLTIIVLNPTISIQALPGHRVISIWTLISILILLPRT